MSKQIAIKEVLDVWITKFEDDSPICYIDYASDSSISTDAERLDLRGGKGNFKLVSFDHTKNTTFMLEVPLVDLSLLAQLTGKDLFTGAVTLPKREVLIVNGSNQITLAATPTTGTLKVYKLDGSTSSVVGRDYGTAQTSGNPSNTNEYSITGAVITLNATSCPQNTKIVCHYDYSSAATTRTITFTADKFPSYLRVCGMGQVTDQITGASDVVTVFDIRKAKPKNNFTITQKSTDATILSMEFDLYATDEDVDGDGITEKVYLTMSELV